MRRLTLHSFFVTISPKTQRISFHNHHIRLIWLRAISDYYPNSKGHSEDTILTRLKRYKLNRRRLWAIPEIKFNKCFDDWKKRWHKCIISRGDYFEGDEIDFIVLSNTIFGISKLTINYMQQVIIVVFSFKIVICVYSRIFYLLSFCYTYGLQT